MAALLALLLFAPGEKLHWSEAHGVGLMLPGTWKIVAHDDGDRAFVVDGPQLGPGVPRAVLWSAGAADRASLEETAVKLAEQIQRRGWTVTTKVRKSIGPFPCVRMAIAFQEPGKAKGRARFTVALLGDRYFVLELSAAASHFPASVFDRMEQSLQVKWSATNFEGGLRFEVPPGWKVTGGAEGGVVEGPRRGQQPTLIFWKREDALARPPPEAKPADAMRFLGKRHKTLVAERELRGEFVRMLAFHDGTWTIVVRMPRAAWDDLFPIAAAIVERAKLAAPG